MNLLIKIIPTMRFSVSPWRHRLVWMPPLYPHTPYGHY